MSGICVAIGAVATAIGAASTAVATAIGLGGTLLGSIIGGAVVGAVIGAAVGAIGSAIMGGDIGKGAMMGAITGFVGGGIGGALSGVGSVASAGGSTAPAGSFGGQVATSGIDAIAPSAEVAGSSSGYLAPVAGTGSTGAPAMTGASIDLPVSSGAMDGAAMPSTVPAGVTKTDVAATQNTATAKPTSSLLSDLAKPVIEVGGKMLAGSSDEEMKMKAAQIKAQGDIGLQTLINQQKLEAGVITPSYGSETKAGSISWNMPYRNMTGVASLAPDQVTAPKVGPVAQATGLVNLTKAPTAQPLVQGAAQ